MREIGAFEAKNRLGSLLDEVERGVEIVITRRGKPVAKLVPATRAHDRAAAQAAVARMKELRKGVTLGKITVKELINEGRR
jgi:prevent-host-death family protein